jgi:hypothetical protein
MISFDVLLYIFGSSLFVMVVLIDRNLLRLVQATKVENERSATIIKRLDAICNGLFELRDDLRVISDPIRSKQAAENTANKLQDDLDALAKKIGMSQSK